MNETRPDFQPERTERSIDLTSLSFDELQMISREMRGIEEKTFRQVADGFENVGGEAIRYREKHGKYKITGVPQAQEFHRVGLSSEVLRNGTTDESELIEAIRQMIAEVGGRIIE
jgi:hypothetical protein